MATETLYQQSEILIAVALLGFMVLGGELGYRLGRRGRQTHNEQTRTQIISIQAATLGLLALLLGFTFAMALSRFEYRKQMVVQESNAIGTAALRSQFLPSSSDDEVSKLFRRYVEIRLESVLRTGQGSSEREQLDREVLQIQGRFWRIANEACRGRSTIDPIGLVHSCNERGHRHQDEAGYRCGQSCARERVAISDGFLNSECCSPRVRERLGRPSHHEPDSSLLRHRRLGHRAHHRP